jgi:eukaryotic-like serine/threonine-protein kinase
VNSVHPSSPPASALPTLLKPTPDGIRKGRATSIINGSLAHRAPVGANPDRPRICGYDILTFIGSGGMGIVFKARQRSLNRIVALKTLRGPAFADNETRTRFQTEAEVVAQLQHPNIVQVFEIGSAETVGLGQPNPFIALEFVDGGSLVDQTSKPQPPRDAAAMIVKLARAVAAAHRLGVVHRDLKPANVLLTREGEPKIADFGLAKQLIPEMDASGRFLTQAGTVVGTPEYMAPEQAAGATPTTAVDIYALGIIFYELLTARVPFQGSTPFETMDLVRFQEPVSPRQLQPSLPRDLETICLKCLEKDPSRRYLTADALADDLQRHLEHRPIHARRVSSIDKARRWCRRNPIAFVSIACVLSILTLAFTAVTRSYWEADSERQKAQQRAEAERLESYRANIAASASALQVFNVDSARRTLEAAPAEHRNWEWYHFQSRLDLATYISDTTDSIPGHVTFSQSGKYAHRTGADRCQVIWNTLERREVATFDWTVRVEFCRGESSVAVVHPDNSITIVDIATGKSTATLTTDGRPIQALTISGDGKRIAASVDNRTIRVWQVDDGQLLQEFKTANDIARGAQISPDGKWLAIDQDECQTCTVWSVDTGKQVAAMVGHDRGFFGATFNQRGDRVLTVEPFPKCCAHLWDTQSGRRIATLTGHRNAVTCCRFSPDGAFVATSSRDQTVRVWKSDDGQPVTSLRGHLGTIKSIEFRDDGKRLASASADNTVRIWDLPTGDLVTVLPGHSGEVNGVHYMPDGGLVSASQDGKVRIWDARTVDGDGILRGHTSFVYGVAFHPDGNRIASASWDSTVRIWDATSGKQLSAFDHGNKAIITSVAFHPAGKILASRDRTAVRLWDLDTGVELQRWSIPSGGWKDTRVAFSPDGKLLAAGCGTMDVRLWNVENREEVAVLRGQMDEVRDVTFSPDGRFLAVAADGGDKRVHIWDVARKERVCVLEGHSAGCYAVAFSRDGSMLASSSTDATVRLWNTTTWKELAVLRHDVSIYGLSFSADGTRLVSACADSSLRFWDTRSYQPVAELRGFHQYYHQVAFSPDGSRLVGACGDCTVRVWDTMPARERATRDARR